MGLVKAESRRLLSRRMTYGIPAVFGALMLAGLVIVFFVAPVDELRLTDLTSSDIEAEGSLMSFIGGVLILGSYVLGASSIGADQKAGVLETLLTWEPRRTRLTSTRLGIGFVVSAVTGILLLSFFSAGYWLVLVLKDGETTRDGDFWSTIVAIEARTALMVGLWFCVGFALALLVKSSVGAIVGFFIYAFIIETVLNFWQTVKVWSPLTNTDGFISGSGVFNSGGFVFGENHHGYAVSGVVVLIFTAICTAAAMAAFHKRDIT